MSDRGERRRAREPSPDFGCGRGAERAGDWATAPASTPALAPALGPGLAAGRRSLISPRLCSRSRSRSPFAPQGRSRSRSRGPATRRERLRSRTGARRAARARDSYLMYFRFLASSPADELAAVRELAVPLIRTTPVVLPFDLSRTVADNCLSLSGMGYYLGIGGCCPACTVTGEPRMGRADRAALILAYVQQLSNIYEYRAFLASIRALGGTDDGGFGGCAPGPGGPTERALAEVLAQPELFFAYHVLRDGGVRDARVLFYRDLDCSGFMMYVVFPGKAIHLHHRLLDHLLTACAGYKIVAHVWQTMFVLVVRRDGGGGRQQSATDAEVPAVSAGDLYCKMSDLNFDGELLLEYRRLYAAFDDFAPPA
ncbi:nuclear egress lamina protein [Bovine herpesvirus type 1.2 strain SM023]|uniref:Nuclear egress lamina protein n=2 Tax=Bovine herpesvirus type 1.2 TaxID=79890 RepID=A0A089N2N3_BHV1|nr:nuclear egress lamina protein [Bovine herpesvirus type 1.2 strain SM023]AIQ80819.1 nuclear egress lamina protein [Bovine herpesvirus type 1.2 strain SP1777]